jgi:hypothetical protein
MSIFLKKRAFISLIYELSQKLITFGTTLFFLLQQKNKVRGGERESKNIMRV